MIWILSIVVSITLLITSCSSVDDGNVSSSEYCAKDSIITKWSDWSERTRDGLWSGGSDHALSICLVDTIAGETDEYFNFYNCYDFSLSGDTLFIVDPTTNQLVCLNLDGTLFWKYGGSGEGPGEFNCLNSVCVGPEWIALGDAFLGKVEVVSKSGFLINSIRVENPTALVTVNDTTIAVLSRVAVGGDIHLYSVTNGFLYSFGYGDWLLPEAYWHLELMGALVGEDGSIWVISCLENMLYKYDLNSYETSFNYAKDFPTELPSTEQVEGGYRVYAIMGDIFVGPEGMVNVLIGGDWGFTTTGNICRSATDETIPVSIIDRYNWDGCYLDSYCIYSESNISEIFYSHQYGFLCFVSDEGLFLRYTIDSL